MSHLVSKRASSRNFNHFTSGPGGEPPKGYVAHSNPLLLSYGMPNAGFFPVNSITVDVPKYPFNTESDGEPVVIKKHTDNKELVDLAEGLQYSPVSGIPLIAKFAKQFINRTHKPSFEWDLTITNGAGDGLIKAVDALLDVDDVVLVEEFTFTPFLQNVANVGAKAVPIKLILTSDSNGIDYDYLENLLNNWSSLQPGLKKPKALYTIPTGQNPTGLTQSVEFRKKILKLAEIHDFAIIEDDPYGYLTLTPYEEPEKEIDYTKILDTEDYLKNHLTPSYLTLDKVGRVIRIETFSKLFAPGLRLGFLVGNLEVIKAVVGYATILTRSSSGPSQTIVNNIITQKFGGVDGWLVWINKMRLAYIHRRNVLVHSIVKSKAHEKGWIEVLDPRAGMFVSVKINFPKGVNVQEKIALLNWKFSAAGVLTVAGINMAVDQEFSRETGTFFRLTYAIANSDEELSEGGSRLANAVFEFFEKGLEF